MNRLFITILGTVILMSCGSSTKSGNSQADSIATSDTTDAELSCAEAKTPISPFTFDGIRKALDDEEFDFAKHVYALLDVDNDGTPEMFIREKVKDYNAYYALCIGSGKPELVLQRSSGGVEEFDYGEGFLRHYEEHTGGMSQAVTYYILKKSKVFMTVFSSNYCDWSNWEEGDDEPEVEQEWSVEKNGKVISTKESDYLKYEPKGLWGSLYDFEEWKSFPSEKSTNERSSFDVLQEQGHIVRELVPSDWENVRTAEGDLNKDGKSDLVVLGLPTYKEHITVREDGYKYNMNEPVIGIYFRDENNYKYKLVTQCSKIIPAMDEFMSIDDMSVDIKSNGVLCIKYQDFHSAGTADVNTNTYLYRYQDGDFYLIGEENEGFSRYSHATENYSTNYLTGKRIITIKSEDGQKPKSKTEIIGKKPLRKFTDGI